VSNSAVRRVSEQQAGIDLADLPRHAVGEFERDVVTANVGRLSPRNSAASCVITALPAARR
jgi:hypothetical protein